ncbi:MAG: BLUF domain-containing protein [Cellvibrionaceae bacterium]
MSDTLFHIGYMSKSVRLMTDAGLNALLNKARINNEVTSLTGMLLYSEGSFLQIIEGPKPAVDNAFQHIQKDSRHQAIKVLFEEKIESRNFTDWTMGFKHLENDQIAHIPGMNAFLENGESLYDHLSVEKEFGQTLKSILLFFKKAA